MDQKELDMRKCDICGDEFGCGVESGHCWCFEIKAQAEVLQKIAAVTSDCVCPRCLLGGRDTNKDQEAFRA